MEHSLTSKEMPLAHSEHHHSVGDHTRLTKSECSGYSYALSGIIDPSDLSNLPEGFYQDPNFEGKSYTCEPEELMHLRSIVATFYNYRNDAFRDMAIQQKHYINMSLSTKELVRSIMEDRFDRQRNAINLNYLFLTRAVEEYEGMFCWKTLTDGDTYLPPLLTRHKDISKIRSTLRQVVREWSTEGQAERDTTFKPCLDLLEAEYPDINSRHNVKVLCPGSGLARLPFDCVTKGFSAQANEFSYFMLITSNYILNEIGKMNGCSVCPGVHNFNNKLAAEDIFKHYSFPDVNIAEAVHPKADFSMASGEFVEVYSKNPESWDVVMTCFFIDTAHNIVEYLQTIHRILKKGGLWINIGPLLYHYAEMEEEQSIELTWNEVVSVAKSIGFTFEHEESISGTYTGIGTTMMETVYHSKLIKARK